MVHGTYFGIQYEIYLKPNIYLDFFNDLLPIWIETRTRIEIEYDKYNGRCKLIIIPYKVFDKQLSKSTLFRQYIDENLSCKYSKELTEEEVKELLFFNVCQYSIFIKHNLNLPEKISNDEFKKLAESWKIIQGKKTAFLSEKECIEIEIERNELFYKLKYQRIMHDTEYFQKIINLEKDITEQVNLTEQQLALINMVISHPKLEGLIGWHGLNLVDGFY
jgi:hypothetical protein